jgi:ATP-binding cassette subfamily G (WHITE) protein 2 (SNQ2)
LTFHPQNYGIVTAFGAIFISALLFFAQVNTSSTTDRSIVLFKQGTKTVAVGGTTGDEETADASGSDKVYYLYSPEVAEKPLPEQPLRTDIFSWQHIYYDIPVPGGEQRLLDDVSGFVAPGKLTALMGESGAGKVGRTRQMFTIS